MSADPARIAIARDMLVHLGITLADLADAERAATDQAPRSGVIIDATTSTAESPPVLGIPARFAMPTLRSYLPRVRAASGPGANRTYGSYWTIMDRMWGERRLDQISATDIEALQHHAATTARSRRNSRHGRHAGEHVVAAARAIYTRATADGYLTAVASPPTVSPNPDAYPAPAEPSPRTNSTRSTPPHGPAATTPSSTPCSCDCTPKPPAAAAALSP